MKVLIVLLVFVSFASTAIGACSKSVDPKKVVLMISLHDGAEEEKGAINGACARGERLIVLPSPSKKYKDLKAELIITDKKIEKMWISSRGCKVEQCEAFQKELDLLQNKVPNLYVEIQKNQPDLESQLKEFNNSSKMNKVKVTSLILSGHDGSGDFSGDYGDTDMDSISDVKAEFPEVYDNVSTLLLMGCWSGVPDQVDMWKSMFSKLRIMGGFVGSAPLSTRLSAGTYINGLLTGEKNLPKNPSKASVQQMVDKIQNVKAVTAGIFINPACSEDASSAFYYVSPSQNDNELASNVKIGLSKYIDVSDQKELCVKQFGEKVGDGDYDWEDLESYYSGDLEPENSPELRRMYSYLRNMEFCFKKNFASAVITPDQVLFLRFYQDAKKNFGKCFKKDLEEMYKNIEAMVEASTDPAVKKEFKELTKLQGADLNKMTRKETLDANSKLTAIFDKLATANPESSALPQIRKTMKAIDTHLYRLKCLPMTWHEYEEGATLAPPQC